MQRLARIAGSFAIVLVAYWVYAHTAVPLIEPSVKEADGAQTGEPTGNLHAGNDYYLKEMQKLFKPGDWQIDTQNAPMVLDINNRAKLLLQKYETQSDGRIKLTPCTMVFLYDGPAESEDERLRQSVVLEAPEGAIVRFDSPLDPRRLKFGRPIGGELQGNITIRSSGKSLGPEDDLLIHARSLVWNDQDASSDYPVDFQWGNNVGSGNGLHIKLAPRAPNGSAVDRGPNVSGIELFEMRKIDRLHIEGDPNKPKNAVAANSAPVGSPAAEQNPLAAARGSSSVDPNPFAVTTDMGPIDVTCSGAFRFNLLKRTAAFEDHVEVTQRNPVGPGNQLLCDKLLMYFVPRHQEQAASNSSTSDLELERIEAQGKPVTLLAPNASPKKSVSARGERLSYNLTTKLIELDGGPEVFLQQGENEIHGTSLKYLQSKSKVSNALGEARVKGPGWLRANTNDQPSQQFVARWNGELYLSPKDDCHVISLTGGSLMDFTGLGKLSAESIYFWISEDTTKQPPWKPVKMLARSNVVLDMASKSNDSAEATQVNGAVDEMKVWFEQKNSPNGIRVETSTGAANTEGGRRKAEGGRENVEEGQARNISFRRSETDNTNYFQTVFRQPAAVPATTSPAIVRPMNAPPVNPNLLPNATQGVVTNPYIPSPASANNQPAINNSPLSSGSLNNSPLPLGEVRGEGILQGGRQQRFAVRGGTLEAKVFLQEDPKDKPELSSLIITGNVRLEETQTRVAGEKPLVITGDKVVVENLGEMNAYSPATNLQPVNSAANRSMPITYPRVQDSAEYKMVVLGQPAVVDGHGLNLSGSNINLDRRANRLWIEGPGVMDLPMPNQLNGQPIAAPGTLNVKWKKGMNFDGLTATFEEEIDVSSPGRHLQTQKLSVKLQQPINFRDPNLQNQNQNNAALLSCDGGVFLESNEFDDKQQRTYVRMQVRDLDFDVQSRVLTAGGPGWLNSVRQDDGSMAQNQQGIFLPIHAATPPPGAAVNPVVQPQPTYPLMGMHVNFQGAIRGNLNPNMQRIDFNDNVHLLYAPVNDWSAMLDPEKTDPLGPNEFMLKCDILEVRHMVHPATKEQSTELDAQGNSVVYGLISNAQEKDVMYTARAMRISYNTAKDQLILEGDGRSDVHLYRQLQLGGPPDDTAMKKIIFYLKTRRISSEGIQSIQINQLPPLEKNGTGAYNGRTR
jgi:lipopolysaccharide export system protein LptA